ncbi:ADP-ribosylation factor GTPase-activating protein 2 isoform X2 [Cylas formicarius]|nr:ADP-ribosylation factor GTPase-activating protein 2 isoform X2 [Cylas formicarius]
MQQLKQMQLGGNANAMQFFSQHNCNTNDAQKKYNSRAAQLYREKLSFAAQAALRADDKLHFHEDKEEKFVEKETPDFFAEHENFDITESESLSAQSLEKSQSKEEIKIPEGEGPKVDFGSHIKSESTKSNITSRKPAAKKTMMGAKRAGGLGATKVKADFASIEREAERAAEAGRRDREEAASIARLATENAERAEAALRLAYRDATEEVKRQGGPPSKVNQIERLGMGVSSRGVGKGVSHSALSDMKVIEQEKPVPASIKTLDTLGRLNLSESSDPFEDYVNGVGIYSKESSWVVVEESPSRPAEPERAPTREKSSSRYPVEFTPSTDEAQRKFGNAKAISSDQFFGDNSADSEAKANLNRFQGSSSISSADFFGRNEDAARGAHNLPAYDIEDVKESVRQGVTRVAGKIGSLANGLMSSIQDRYGY